MNQIQQSQKVDVRTTEGQFQAPTGHAIFYRYWHAHEHNDHKRLILLVHGSGEHIGRYQGFASRLISRGYSVVALDHIGHGQSEGTPRHIDCFRDYVDTLALFHEQVGRDFPDHTHLLFGHSMGGLIASHYLLEHQQKFAGAALSGAAIKSDMQPSDLTVLVMKALSKTVPHLPALALEANAISRDPLEVQRYSHDPLVRRGKLTVRKAVELFFAMGKISAEASTITLPILLLHGEADRLTSPLGSRFLHETVSSEDKTLKIYPELYHEMHHEPERETFYEDLLTWLDQH